MSRKGWLLFIAMGVIWGLPYLLIKISVREVAPPMLVEMRTGGAALLLVPIALARGAARAGAAPLEGARRVLPRRDLDPLASPLQRRAETLESSLAGLLVAAVPLASALLARVTGTADRLDRRQLLGVLIGLGGVAALVGFNVAIADIWAALSIGVVAIGYAVGPWILSRYLSDLSALGVMAAGLALCAVIYAPIAAFSVPTRPLSTSVVASVVGLTLICTALAFVLFFALIAEVGPVRSTVITYVNPAVAVLLGVSVLGERFGVGTAAGFVLIVVGCVLATRRRATEALAAPAPSVLLAGGGNEPDVSGHRVD